jgi:tripartite-type tricarboxylate transporter receptor subunit TctC
MRTIKSLAVLAVRRAPPIPAAAQYPNRPVKLIVPFAGRRTDGHRRAHRRPGARQAARQPVVVENRPGADGAIAAQAVATAAPDGYTLFFASTAVFAIPHVVKPAPYQMADFVPVSSVGKFDFCLYVSNGVPARTPQELIAHARAHPGKLNYATNNLGEQLLSSQFIKAAGGIDMVRVPYKGMAQAMPDLIAATCRSSSGR